jgi:hypothetical protein
VSEVVRGAPDRIRFWLIVAALLALTAPLLRGSLLFNQRWPYPTPLFARGDYERVMSTQGHARILSIYIGLAARDVAGRDLEAIYAPATLSAVANRDGDEFFGEAKAAFNAAMIEQSAGGPLVTAEYDTVLTAGELSALEANARFVEYSRGVVGVQTAEPDPEVLLFSDEEGQTIYVVAASVAPRSVP